jgi:hypothetical protein
MSLDVPSILYSVINEIGKDRIRTDVFSDITLSQVHCEEILKRCKAKLGKRASPEVMATICEGLLHFMLTTSMLPSQRKSVVRGIELDVVIPSARALLNDPEKSIVIQVIKTDVEAAKIENPRKLQPNIENIWVISSCQFLTTCRKYDFDTDNSFVRIIIDIHNFVTSRGITGLKLFHGD